jgi:Zn-dependent protease
MEQVALILISVIPAILAVTVHEIAHGWTALQLGDYTAAQAGRLSLNPLKHIDPVGTILVPAVLYVLSEWFLGVGVPFGWAKPVPVQWSNLNPERPGIAIVAAAGPSSNLLMMAAWTLLAMVLRHTPLDVPVLISVCRIGIIVNGIIMTINLIPIPPLDGSRIVTALLPPRMAVFYNRFEMHGLVVIVLLVVAAVYLGIVDSFVGSALRGLSALGI